MPDDTSPEAALLTSAEAAAVLGCSVSTVSRLATAGRIPTAHKGPGLRGARFFRRGDVMWWKQLVEWKRNADARERAR